MAGTLLDRVRALHRQALLVERVRWISVPMIVSMLTIAGAVSLDHLVRWPAPMRLALLAIGLLMAVQLVRRAIVRGWMQAPSMQGLAIRIERVEPALRGMLASAIDFQASGLDASSELARQAVARADVAWQMQRPSSRLRMGRGGWPALACAALIFAWSSAIWLNPQATLVGLRRTLTPWSGDQWPARVAIELLDPIDSVARGTNIMVRVRVTRGDAPEVMVRARCTTTMPGGQTREREMDLVRQADGWFERPILAEGERMRIELSAEDAETQSLTVGVVTPPSIQQCRLDVQPPAYAAKDQPTVALEWPGFSAPDPGSILAGSRASLWIKLDAPAPLPHDTTDEAGVAQLRRMVRCTSASGAPLPPPQVSATDASQWTVAWTANEPMELWLQPMDASGVSAPDALRLSLRVTPDREPSVSVIDPDADESITTQAIVPFTIEASDDLSLASIAWQVNRQQRSGEPAPTRLAGGEQASGARSASLKGQLQVSALQVRAGDVLLLHGIASDHCEVDGALRAPVRSEPRRLQVVERETLERQVRQQVNSLRQAVARLEAAQQDISSMPDAANASRAQAGLTDRMRQAETTTRNLVDRLKQNQMAEITITDTLTDAGQLGRQAQTQSTDAQEALQRAASGDASSLEQARAMQKQAQQSLQAMLDALDRDDDAAAAQRRADRLAESIRALRKDLAQASQSAAGKSPEELSSSERQSLQEQALRQRAAADEARAMLDDLRARSERAEGKDRAQSRTLKQAAEEGEKGQASRRMDEAADRTERNQATAADASMQAAEEAIDKVRETLREDRRARTEDLRRRLASLEETLQALIRTSEAITTSINVADVQPAGFEAIALQCIQLSRNSGSASEQAREAGASTRQVSRVIDRATERFDVAVTALRAQPVATNNASDAMQRGTELLRDALKQVKDIQRKEQQRSQDRERNDLAKTYHELSTQVRAVREATVRTIPPEGGRMDRRGAASQREQAERLQAILQSFQTGPKASELMVDAQTFKAAHARIESDMTECIDPLRAANAGARVVRKLDLVADTLDSLSIALRDPEQGEDPFADGKDSSPQEGGGQGGPGDGKKGLPPIAELRLVRQMQAQVNTLTKTLDTARTNGQTVDAELGELGAMQDEVRRLGEDWIQRMNERNDKPTTPKRSGTEVSPTDAYPWQDPPQAQTPPSSGPQPKDGAPAVATPPKTLDELLGLDGPAGGDSAAQAQRDRKLSKNLKEEDLRDLAKSATESMQLATSLVGERKDPGIGTQRVQAEALANLDALIDAATQFKKQQSQGSSSGSKKSQSRQDSSSAGKPQDADASASKPEQASSRKPEASTQRARDGTQGDQVQPPPPEDADGSRDGVLEEGRSEWGRLPQRIREIMSQARRDKISAIYQQATESYYRRMAEDRNP